MRLLLCDKKGLIMDDLLQHLEKRIQTFLDKYVHTNDVNQTLQRSKTQLVREKEQLLSKHKNAIVQIENMLSRLKSIEGQS